MPLCLLFLHSYRVLYLWFELHLLFQLVVLKSSASVNALIDDTSPSRVRP